MKEQEQARQAAQATAAAQEQAQEQARQAMEKAQAAQEKALLLQAQAELKTAGFTPRVYSDNATENALINKACQIAYCSLRTLFDESSENARRAAAYQAAMQASLIYPSGNPFSYDCQATALLSLIENANSDESEQYEKAFGAVHHFIRSGKPYTPRVGIDLRTEENRRRYSWAIEQWKEKQAAQAQARAESGLPALPEKTLPDKLFIPCVVPIDMTWHDKTYEQQEREKEQARRAQLLWWALVKADCLTDKSRPIVFEYLVNNVPVQALADKYGKSYSAVYTMVNNAVARLQSEQKKAVLARAIAENVIEQWPHAQEQAQAAAQEQAQAAQEQAQARQACARARQAAHVARQAKKEQEQAQATARQAQAAAQDKAQAAQAAQEQAQAAQEQARQACARQAAQEQAQAQATAAARQAARRVARCAFPVYIPEQARQAAQAQATAAAAQAAQARQEQAQAAHVQAQATAAAAQAAQDKAQAAAARVKKATAAAQAAQDKARQALRVYATACAFLKKLYVAAQDKAQAQATAAAQDKAQAAAQDKAQAQAQAAAAALIRLMK